MFFLVTRMNFCVFTAGGGHTFPGKHWFYTGHGLYIFNGSYGNGSNMSWDDSGTAVSGAGVHVTWDSLLPHWFSLLPTFYTCRGGCNTYFQWVVRQWIQHGATTRRWCLTTHMMLLPHWFSATTNMTVYPLARAKNTVTLDLWTPYSLFQWQWIQPGWLLT